MRIATQRCPFLDKCPMFEKLRLEATKKIIVEKYCLGDYTKCKRYIMRITGETPPPNMLPDGTILNIK